MAFGKRRNKGATLQAPHIEREKIVSRIDQTVVADGGNVKPRSRVGQYTDRYVKPRWQKRPVRIVFTALALTVVLAIVIAAILLLKEDKVEGAVCDKGTITRYNVAVKTEGEGFGTKLKDTASHIESLKGYDTDINCVFMVYYHYAYARDVDRSRQLLDRMKELNTKGNKIDESIIGQSSFDQMEGYVKSLEFNRDLKGGKGDGSG